LSRFCFRLRIAENVTISGHPPKFAIATFKRVFEVTPRRDLLTLEELTAGLTRFILKPKLRLQIERDVARIDEAWKAIQEGRRLGGRRWSYIRRGEKRGGKEGAQKAYDKLMSKAIGRTKTDLRIWSPALYPPNSRRESENVVHLSCLVLDYDSGVSINEASDQWTRWYHIVHTTWSHTPGHPKFRLILPLAKPVYAEDWRPFWTWGAERAGMLNDPALKSPSSTYALPVTQGLERQRVAFVHRAPLLNPVAEGLVRRAAPPPPPIEPMKASHFRGDPDLKFVESEPDDDDFDLFGSSSDSSGGSSAEAEPEPNELDEFDLF